MAIKKIVFFVLIIFAFIVINDLSHGIYNLWQKNDLAERNRQALVIEKVKNSELKKQYKAVTDPHFVEEEARNKLFMVKPGEGIVVIAPTEYLRARSPRPEHKDGRPNWKQWQEMFF